MGGNTIGAYVKEFLTGAVEAFARAGYYQTGEFGTSLGTFGPEFQSPFAPAATNELQLARDLGPAGLVLGGLVVGKVQVSFGTRAAAVTPGTTVFRVWGGEAKASGRSWTTVDPRTVPNYRDLAGLPSQNSGSFLIQGILYDTRGIATRGALPLHGNAGGLPEVIIPNPSSQIIFDLTLRMNPGL